MYRIVVIIVMLLVTSCSASRDVVVAQRTREDSVCAVRVMYDSVYVGDQMRVDRVRDTVYVDREHVELRFRLRHDTVRVATHDSVPVIHEVEVIREVKYIPWYARGKLWCVVIIVGLCFILHQTKSIIKQNH